MNKVIGIIGSRRRNSFKDYKKVFIKVMEIYKKGDSFVSGGCPKGADNFAEKIAMEKNIPITIYKAEWDKYGKVAGFFRNTYIADDADVLIACVAKDRKGGTEDTIKKYTKTFKKKKLFLV